MKSKRLIMFASLVAISALAFMGGQMTTAGDSVHGSDCRESETRRMTGALEAIFPDAEFGPLMRSACLGLDRVGVDSSGALVFGDNAVLTGVELGPITAPEDLPVETFHELLPDIDLKQMMSTYHFAYGYDRDWNSGAHVIRRADGSGPVIVLIADLI